MQHLTLKHAIDQSLPFPRLGITIGALQFLISGYQLNDGGLKSKCSTILVQLV